MQASLGPILQTLFQQTELDAVPEQQLLDYISQHPYAGIGHVLLAKKKKEAGQDYQSAAAKAALYLNNPLWLHYLLQGAPVTTTATTPKEASPEVFTALQQEAEAPAEAAAIIENVTEPVVETETASVAEETPAPSSLSTLLSAAAREVAPAAPGEEKKEPETLAFEPYHTIDYFASQGIKLTREDLDKDRFGRQLKSFTEWLKSMKKIAPVATAEANPPDQLIEKKAEASVVPSDVDTEAMAEVWLKQGNKEKAIAIYHKLSLQNPSKSHYFASLIEQIKA